MALLVVIVRSGIAEVSADTTRGLGTTGGLIRHVEAVCRRSPDRYDKGDYGSVLIQILRKETWLSGLP